MIMMNFLINQLTMKTLHQQHVTRLFCNYLQGQSPDPKVREYFYYIDHQGMLFLDDTKIKNFTSCFKDKKFLSFFFKRLRTNNTDRYTSFPYLSLCGRERNYVRCDDLPLVFTQVLKKENKETGRTEDYFSYNYGNELLVVPFEPSKIIMRAQTGRIYHPAPDIVGGIGLVKSSLAIEFSTMFYFEKGEEHGPTHFCWQGKKYVIDSEWSKEKETENNIGS